MGQCAAMTATVRRAPVGRSGALVGLAALAVVAAVAAAAPVGAGPDAAAPSAEAVTRPAGSLRVLATDPSAYPEVVVTVAAPSPASEAGRATPVRAFAVDGTGATIPVTVEAAGASDVVLLLDTSGEPDEAMLRSLRAAAVEFVLSTMPGVRTAVMTAGEGPEVLSPLSADVTSVMAGLSGLPTPGPPGLGDDLAAAAAELAAEDRSTSTIVVLSPRAGPPVDAELERLVAEAVAPGLPVYVVHPRGGGGVATTAPVRFVDAGPLGLVPAMAQVARDLDRHYVLRFRAGAAVEPVDLRLVEGGRIYRTSVGLAPAVSRVVAAVGAMAGEPLRARGLLTALLGLTVVASAGWQMRRSRPAALARAPAMFSYAPVPAVAVPGGAPPVGTGAPVGAAPVTVTWPSYVSADSAPTGYAVRRSPWVALSFVLLLVGAGLAVVPALDASRAWYAEVLASVVGATAGSLDGPGATLSFRPFLALFFVLLGLFSVGPLAQRLAVVATGWALFLSLVLVGDILMASAPSVLPPPLSPGGGVLPGLVGIGVLVATVFLHYELPPTVQVERELPSDRRRLATLGRTVLLALGLAVAYSALRAALFPDLHVRFLGSLSSGIVVFLLAVYAGLAVVAARDRKDRPGQQFDISVAFLVPAHNEATGIGGCLDAIDAAAARYFARCKVYVVDNASTDGTADVARAALERCRHLVGEVFHCPQPGKGYALNFGLARIGEEVVIRVDADTLVEPRILTALVPWFGNPRVGGVSGLPLPNPTRLRWLYPLRVIEVLYGVAFLRVAQTGADAVMVMPGLVASYRTRVLRQLGGFGQGFNGEDADITFRIGRAGYRVVTDPRVRVRTEVPQSLAQLREQRQRWARGLFHMAARNMSGIRHGQGVRSVVLLPWSLFNAGRRVLMVPVLLTAGAVELVEPEVFDLRELSMVVGFLVGVQLLVIAGLLVWSRHPRALLYLPGYVVFRMFRAYIAFETVLTLQLRPGRRSPA